ncbi:hypothetical protein O0L34_g12453 [Tuta absoluta]|nr:hypothetical protein O0L34_g12453 [Tuta absoluta]
MCAWGYKFEQYMAADSPHLNPDIQKPVIENAEFSLCFRAVLGSHQLLYAAQIDGLLATEGNVSDPPRHADYETNLNYLRNNKYIELKTNRELHHRRHEDSFKRHKMLKCWAQCYLANLHGLLVGYRNNSGIVQRLQYFKTDQIVEYCKDFWSPGPALEFLDYFLTFVKNTFKEYVKQTHGEHSDFKKIGPINLEFHIDNNQRIQFTDQCDKILPDWYVEAKNVNEM